MTTAQIRQKLLNFLESYRKNAGTFNSLAVIHDFVEFLKSEPYALSIIKPHLEYVEKQTAITEKNLDLFENVGHTIDQELISKMPMFKTELALAQKALNEGRPHELSPAVAFPVYLNNLLLIHKLVDSLKINGSQEQMTITTELSSVNLLCKIPGLNIMVSSSVYLTNAMVAIIKPIVDKIDGEHFLAKGKANKSLSFNAQASVLNIKGKEIKISRKSDPSTDHFILEAIFKREEIDEAIEFKDIAHFMGIDEYDGVKDWQRFRHACDKLNQKVDKSTKGEVKEFIIYTTGKTGWCKINPEYL